MKLNLSEAQLRSIILSHGWFSLEPFITSIAPPYFMTAFELPSGSGAFEVSTSNGHCKLRILSGSSQSCISVAKNCLSLDIMPDKLYSVGGKKWQWLEKNNMGRFLRSPSLFEDCCKVILSTCTTWQRTIIMVKALVQQYGESIDGQQKAFPRPDIIVATADEELRAVIGCGFRAKYLHHLARMALNNPHFFLDDGWNEFSSSDFYNKLTMINGIGAASANYLSLLYWKPNGFNIDAYVKRRCKELWKVNERGIHAFLKKRYKQFGNYAPLILWFEITRHWQVTKPSLTNEW